MHTFPYMPRRNLTQNDIICLFGINRENSCDVDAENCKTTKPKESINSIVHFPYKDGMGVPKFIDIKTMQFIVPNQESSTTPRIIPFDIK